MRCPDRHPRAGQLATGGRLGDAEVGDQRLAVLVEHDVVGLDVPVHDVVAVRVGERPRDLNEDVPDLHRGQRATRGEQRRQRLAAQVLHDEVDHPPRLPDPVDRDDARVLEPRRGAGLALEALDELLVERERERQHLDRDLAVELLFPRVEHDRHPAAPQLLEDLVLVLELAPDQIVLGGLFGLGGAGGDRVDHGIERQRRRQIGAAGLAELEGFVVLRAAMRTVHPSSGGNGVTYGPSREHVNVLCGLNLWPLPALRDRAPVPAGTPGSRPPHPAHTAIARPRSPAAAPGRAS
jgi:hypothetical protein